MIETVRLKAEIRLHREEVERLRQYIVELSQSTPDSESSEKIFAEKMVQVTASSIPLTAESPNSNLGEDSVSSSSHSSTVGMESDISSNSRSDLRSSDSRLTFDFLTFTHVYMCRV